MTDLPISYTEATVDFPESGWRERRPELRFRKNEIKFENGKIYFIRNNCLIQARVFPPCNVPLGLSRDRTIKTEIVKPALESVVKDLETVDDLFEKLRTLEIPDRVGRLQYDFFYERDPSGFTPSGFTFRVYDYFSYNDTGAKPFEILKKFNSLPEILLKDEYKTFYRISSFIEQEESRVPYIKESTLRGATEKALMIYGWAEELRKLTF